MKTTFRKITAATLALAATATAALADSSTSPAAVTGPGNFSGPGWGGGPMMGYGGYGGGGWIMMIFGLIIVVALLVFLFRASTWTAHPPHQPMPHNRTNSTGLHALDERYARGEINREEYLQKKRDILEG